MLKTLALSASVIAFAGGLALAETTMTRQPSTGRSVANASSSLSTDHWLASDGVMKAALPLVLTALQGLGSGGAVAQIAPGDPAGNQTIQRRICRGQVRRATVARKAEAESMSMKKI